MCFLFSVFFYAVCFKHLAKRLQIVEEQWYHPDEDSRPRKWHPLLGNEVVGCGGRPDFRKEPHKKQRRATSLMSSHHLENKRRVLTRVTSYLLCSFTLWFLLYFQDKQSQRQRNLMQLGRALLGSSAQIGPLSPEVVGVWCGMGGEGDAGRSEGREGRNRREEKRRQGRSDEVVKLRGSWYLGVQSGDEMWWWYLGCEKDISLLCFMGLKGHWAVTTAPIGLTAQRKGKVQYKISSWT